MITYKNEDVFIIIIIIAFFYYSEKNEDTSKVSKKQKTDESLKTSSKNKIKGIIDKYFVMTVPFKILLIR